MTILSETITDLGDVKPVIVIGGKNGKFVPNMNISFLNDEYYININRKEKKIKTELAIKEGEKTKLGGDDSDIFYIDADGKFKWDIEFNENPKKNIFTWELSFKSGVEFYFQGELTQEEIDRGVNRPEQVVNSYAVYCDKQNNKYKTGKLCHIYRPLCVDAKGEKSYAEINIDKNTLTITIDQKYMDNATYPMTLDPTFGYTSQGGSSEAANNSFAWATRFNSPDAGTAISISAYVTGLSWQKWKYALYDYTSSNQDLLSGTDESTAASDGWSELELTTDQAITASEYALALQGNNSGVLFYTDTVGASSQQQGYVSHTYSDEWADPANFSFNNTNRFSIYCTYTAAGGTGNNYYYQQQQM